MTAQYLVLAVALAFTLNHANRFVRAGGTLLAAIGLAFIVLSIVLAGALHPVLYALILGLPVTGLLLSVSQGGPLEIYGWMAPLAAGTSSGGGPVWAVLHNQVLPILFYGVIAMHLGAVLKHHFIARRPADVRRMLR